jgi:S1/P1 Nuclease
MRTVLRSTMAAFLGLILIAPPQARAWNSIGHMAVGYIAYQQLTPAAKARVNALLAMNPDYSLWVSYIPAGTPNDQRDLYIFMMAATWPDEIKLAGSGYTADGPRGGDSPPPNPTQANLNIGYTDMTMHKYWHFIDIPFAVGKLALPPVPTPNAQTQIEVFRTVLASGASDGLKSYDLAWIEHLVGDIHQPLHCSTRVTAGMPQGDAGGNDVKTNPPPELHAYWDDLLGLGNTSNYSVAVTAAQSLPAASSSLVADTNVADWTSESFKLAKSKTYKNPPVGNGLGLYTLTSAYHTAALTVAKQRIALAGARLAKLLNDNLK